MENDDDDDFPFTAAQLRHTADQAWRAGSAAAGVELVLGNLIAALDGQAGFGATAFTTGLLHRLNQAQDRIPAPALQGARSLLQRLQVHLAQQLPADPGSSEPPFSPSSAPPGTLFH